MNENETNPELGAELEAQKLLEEVENAEDLKKVVTKFALER